MKDLERSEEKQAKLPNACDFVTFQGYRNVTRLVHHDSFALCASDVCLGSCFFMIDMNNWGDNYSAWERKKVYWLFNMYLNYPTPKTDYFSGKWYHMTFR